MTQWLYYRLRCYSTLTIPTHGHDIVIRRVASTSVVFYNITTTAVYVTYIIIAVWRAAGMPLPRLNHIIIIILWQTATAADKVWPADTCIFLWVYRSRASTKIYNCIDHGLALPMTHTPLHHHRRHYLRRHRADTVTETCDPRRTVIHTPRIQWTGKIL